MSIRCPKCRQVRRMPASRPHTIAQARAVTSATADDDGGLAAWEAEAPYVADWRKTPGAESGQACPKCGKPMRWTGAHTALVCLACSVWTVSPGAKTRAAEHLAAIDKSAARRSAQLADPEAERLAAEVFAAERAELLDDLDGLADLLNVSGFPRDDAEYAPARRAGIRYGGTVALYSDRAHKAETLDQLRRVAADAERFAAGIEPWLDRIADLRAGLEDDEPGGRAIPGEVEYDDEDDDDQADDAEADDDAESEQAIRAMLDRAGQLAALPPGSMIPAALTGRPGLGTYCAWCSAAQRRVNGCYPEAVARIEAPGMVPAPVDVCADHLAEARQRHGAALHVHDQFWAAYDTAVRMVGSQQAIEYARAAAQPRQGARALPWRRGA
jgi:hypothetical protein